MTASKNICYSIPQVAAVHISSHYINLSE